MLSSGVSLYRRLRRLAAFCPNCRSGGRGHKATHQTSAADAYPSLLALELRRSLDYFESHNEQTSIRELHTSGLEAADREAIAAELGVAVREVDLTTLFDTDDALSAELQRLCMPAIGAALRKDPVAL